MTDDHCKKRPKLFIFRFGIEEQRHRIWLVVSQPVNGRLVRWWCDVQVQLLATIQYTVYTVYSIYSILYTVYYTVYSVHYTATNISRECSIAAAKHGRLDIISRVSRMRIAASLTFCQTNIRGRLKLLTSCSEDFDVTWCTKFHKEVRITSLTEKKLCLQNTEMVDSTYALTRLAHATFSCCKWLSQGKLRS